MSPVTGPVATAIALALAVALGMATHSWELRQARYEARIAQLSEAGDRTQTALRSELAACRAQGDGRLTVAAADAPAAPGTTAAGAGAKRLLEQQPEGIDACARMESADRAVLSNLKK